MPTDEQIKFICKGLLPRKDRDILFHECKEYLRSLREEMANTPKEKRAYIKEKYNKEYYKARVVFGTWRNLYSY